MGQDVLQFGGVRFTKTQRYKWHDNKLWYVSANGEHVEDYKCNRNTDKYRLYAIFFNCALPSTVYLIADKETGIVYQSSNIHFPKLAEIKADLNKGE